VISDLVFSRFSTGDIEADERIRANFAHLWSHFASDFLNENFDREYNSIKHGSRAKFGGFYFALGLEDEPGVPAPPERMQAMANSVFGSSFFVPDRLKDNRNFTVSHQALNWVPGNYVDALHLISASIHNAVAFLRIMHGVPQTEVPFAYYTEDESYQLPWSRSTGMTGLRWNSQIPEKAIEPLTKEDILSVYRRIRINEV